MKDLCGRKFSTPLGKHQGVWLLDLMVRLCLVLEETVQLVSKVAAPFASPPAVTEVPAVHVLASTGGGVSDFRRSIGVS